MNDYIFTYNQQNSTQSQQEQAEKKMPYVLENFLNQYNSNSSLLDMITTEVLTSEDFNRVEREIDKISEAFADYYGLSAEAHDNMMYIAYECECLAFKAGFQAAKELFR